MTTTPAPLTYKTAQDALKPPLRFGDLEQIKAVHFITLYEEVVDLIKKASTDQINCPECDGTNNEKCESCNGLGTCYHCGHECEDCDGEGTVTCHACDPIQQWRGGKHGVLQGLHEYELQPIKSALEYHFSQKKKRSAA